MTNTFRDLIAANKRNSVMLVAIFILFTALVAMVLAMGIMVMMDDGAALHVDLTRSVIEGVCYSLRDCIEIFRGMKVPVDEVRVTGGGAKNQFWFQTLADIFGQSTCSLEASEGAAYGVALLAAVGTKHFKSVEEACDATVKTCNPVKPDAKRFAFVSAGQDTPLFDETMIQFLP